VTSRLPARPHARLLALAAALAVVATLGVPAAATSAKDPVPTPAQIAAEKAKAAQLAARAVAQTKQLAAEQARLQELANQSSAALQQFNDATGQAGQARAAEAQARAAEAQARAAAEAAAAQFESAKADEDEARTKLRRYASALYRQGQYGQLVQYGTLLESGNPAEFARRLQSVRIVATTSSGAVDDLETARAAAKAAQDLADEAHQQAEAARSQAEASRQQAEAAEAAAAAARQQAAALASQQKRQVAAVDAARAASQAGSAAATNRAQQMEKARAEALRRAAEDAKRRAREQAQGIPALADGCANPYPETRGGYRNGCIPKAALKSVWGYPYHYLRGDAAAAFDRMSRDYAGTFGKPICVTDSYRSYAQQVALKAIKPVLAATPGTSNHGWGQAVDLCDGVNSFNSVTHQWMRANAPRFGWYLPSWAQQGGSKPEPWHWEFGG
jgi:D-alanyl-D-alanine carboxypeptidase